MRKGMVVIWLAFVFAAITALFWHDDWVYGQPTPVPQNYRCVSPGRVIALPSEWKPANDKPVFLHFFNPHCPCSRFNIEHFRSLVKQYGQKVNFAIVVMTNKNYTAKEVLKKFDISIPVFFDTTIAVSCGVYSTPQAVIIDTTHRLFYRGNYNKSRYCSNKKTEYARIALDALLNKQPANVSDKFALTAYGCSLPTCNKK
jgi:hypothetical protein